MKVLVTGATGFVGSHVVNELLEQGYEVVATARSLSKAKNYDWYDDVLFVPFDVFNECDSKLPDAFCAVDIVMHLTWSGLPNYNSLSHVKDNLFSSYKLLRELIRHDIKKILVTGTCLEYGMRAGAIDENYISDPQNGYAIAKDELRKLILALQKEHEFDLVWARLFYLYGAGQNSNSLYSQLQMAINKKQKQFKMSHGDQLRDFLSIELAAEYLVGLINPGISGSHIVNCCSGKPRSVLSMVEEWVSVRDSQISLELGCYPVPEYEPKDFWGNNDKLLSLLNRDVMG